MFQFFVCSFSSICNLHNTLILLLKDGGSPSNKSSFNLREYNKKQTWYVYFSRNWCYLGTWYLRNLHTFQHFIFPFDFMKVTIFEYSHDWYFCSQSSSGSAHDWSLLQYLVPSCFDTKEQCDIKFPKPNLASTLYLSPTNVLPGLFVYLILLCLKILSNSSCNVFKSC